MMPHPFPLPKPVEFFDIEISVAKVVQEFWEKIKERNKKYKKPTYSSER